MTKTDQVLMAKDRLGSMFKAKEAFQEKVGNKLSNEPEPELVATFALGLYSEIGEVLQEYKRWKPWKNDEGYNEKDMLQELADVWHFLINLTLALGVDCDTVYNEFVAKHKKLMVDDEYSKEG